MLVSLRFTPQGCSSLRSLFHRLPSCLDGALSVLTVPLWLWSLGREIDEDAFWSGGVLRLHRSADDGFGAGRGAGGAGGGGPAEVCERGGGRGAVEEPHGAEGMDAGRWVAEGQLHRAGPAVQEPCGGHHSVRGGNVRVC